MYLATGDHVATFSASRLLHEVAVRQVPAFSTFPDGEGFDEHARVGASPAAIQLINVGVPHLPLNLPFNGVRIGGSADHSGWIFWSGRSEEMPYVSVPIE